MRPKSFTEEQIIMILKEHEAGMRVQDLVRTTFLNNRFTASHVRAELKAGKL